MERKILKPKFSKEFKESVRKNIEEYEKQVKANKELKKILDSLDNN